MLNHFIINEGNNKNLFVLEDDFRAHIILTEHKKNRIYICFPVENSGIAFQINENEKDIDNINFNFKGDVERYSYGKKDVGVSFNVEITAKKIIIDRICMDNIRAIRDLKDYFCCVRRYESDRKYLLYKNIDNKGILKPELILNDNHILIKKKTIDLKNNYYAEIKLMNKGKINLLDEGKIEIISDEDRILLNVKGSIDYKLMETMKKDEILNEKARIYFNSLKEESERKKFDEALTNLTFLSYKEKLCAGSYRFLTYFGRDTLLSSMLLKYSASEKFYSNAIQSVINRISNKGVVAHEEDIGGQALFRKGELYNTLIEMSEDKFAEEIDKKLSTPIYDYKMIDDDFLFPVALGELFKDNSFTDKKKTEFLNYKNSRNETNLDTILKNFDYCLSKADKYFNSRDKLDLVKITEEYIGDWRDSWTGLGFGKYPSSVNVETVKNALINIDFTLKEINRLNKNYFNKIKNNFKFINKYHKNGFDDIIKCWNEVKKIFEVRMTNNEVRERLNEYLKVSNITETERNCLLNINLNDGIKIKDFLDNKVSIGDLKYYALSLDENGNQVKVINTDIGFGLFLGEPDIDFIENSVRILRLNYPVGIKSPFGYFIANPIYSDNKNLWTILDRNAYHGTVIWSWQNCLIQKGLMKQIKRLSNDERYRNLVKDMRDILKYTFEMEKNAGELVNSELWTYRATEKGLEPIAYGLEATSATESNPVQLWSTTILSVMHEYDELKNNLN